MKKLLLLLILGFTFSITTYAQNTSNSETPTELKKEVKAEKTLLTTSEAPAKAKTVSCKKGGEKCSSKKEGKGCCSGKASASADKKGCSGHDKATVEATTVGTKKKGCCSGKAKSSCQGKKAMAANEVKEEPVEQKQ